MSYENNTELVFSVGYVDLVVRGRTCHAYNGFSSTGVTVATGGAMLLVIKLIPFALLPPGDKPPLRIHFNTVIETRSLFYLADRAIRAKPSSKQHLLLHRQRYSV